MLPEALMTPSQAAEIIGTSVKTLMGHVKNGRIRCIVVGGGQRRKRRRFTQQNIDSFIKRQKIRECLPCPSTGSQIRLSTNTTFKSTVVDFMAVPKPGASPKPSKSSVT